MTRSDYEEKDETNWTKLNIIRLAESHRGQKSAIIEFNYFSALAGVVQWIESWPVSPGVTSSIPIIGQVPSWGCARGNHTMCLLHIDVSLSSPFPRL